MERLAGVDAGFLYMETPTAHMHTIKVAVLEVAADYSFEQFTTALTARLHLLPPFRRRVVEVPFRLNHPVWVEDHDIDPTRHLFRHVLPSPGGMAELEALVGEVASEPLARDVPLWEMHVAEGLADGRVAVVTKMHHALADGIAANALLANTVDLPEEGMGRQSARWAPEPTPEPLDLVRSGLLDAIRQIALLPGLLLRTLSSVLAVLRVRRTAGVSTPRPILDTPHTSFNGALTARRSFATASLPLDDLKRVRKAMADTAPVTLNDVVLAVVAGALRAWLDARGEHPSGSLTAGVPVGAEVPGAGPRLAGNRVSNMFTSLHTDVDDPRERLLAIARTTTEAKALQGALGASMLREWSQFTPPAPFSAFMRAYSRWQGANRHRAPFNVIVSNVPGPRTRVSFAGAPLTDLYSVGPLLEGLALNVTVWSYLDRMNVSLLTCPDLLPDLPALAGRLRASLGELLDICL